MASNTVPQIAVSQPRQSWWASLVILCAILGALLGLSVKSRDVIRRQQLPADNYAGLSVAYQFLKQKDSDDTRLIADQRQRVTDLEKGTSSESEKDKALLADLQQAKFAAGMTAVAGPGVIVTLNDSKKPYPAASQIPGMAPPNIIHDIDINQTVNELKAAGAEAVSVNSQRLIATSPIRCAGPTVFVNNTAQTPPYKIQAIGNAKTLQEALNLPGGEADQLRAFDPAMFTVQTVPRLVLPASPGPPPPTYAHSISDTYTATGGN
jgi:uncharacterized protein YlxW (UPF0749 family)